MHERSKTFRSLPTILFTAALLSGSLAVAAPAIVSAVGPCTPKEDGSTTVFPAIDNARPVWQGLSVNSGCTVTLGTAGSGAGLDAARAFTVNFAASSRPLKAGAESTALYAWKIGGDAMTFQVASAPSMSFITQITAAQVQGIWNNTITNWSDLGGPNQAIIADCRIVGSGSQGDLTRLFAISATAEAAACDSRLQTSADEAAAANTPFHIVYTSLANVGIAGTKELKLSGGAPLITGIGNASTFVSPSVATVQNGTYPAPRELFLAANKFPLLTAGVPTDTTAYVKAYDFINYMASSAGQGSVAAVGFVPVAPFVAIPDYDVNLDGVVSLPDLGQVTGKWSQNNAVNGWVRADVNNDGTIALGDIGGVTGRWGGTGFVAP